MTATEVRLERAEAGSPPDRRDARAPGPPLSVLLCVHDGLPYLEEAVESIRAQTYADFEFLIVDDGSTDPSPSIIERAAVADPRIRLVRRGRRGQNVSLNEGLSLVRAPLVARMDADDVALPRRLELQVRHLHAHPECVAVGGQWECIDEQSLRLFQRPRQTAHEDIVAQLLRGTCELAHPSVMFRREAVLSVGGYDDAYGSAADFELWLRLREIGELHNLPETVLKYRLHYRQMSSRHRVTQGRLTRLAIEKTLARQGGQPPPLLEAPLPPRTGSRTDWHVMLAYECWGHGSLQAARRHLLIAARREPLRVKTWIHLVLCLCRLPTGWIEFAARAAGRRGSTQASSARSRMA